MEKWRLVRVLIVGPYSVVKEPWPSDIIKKFLSSPTKVRTEIQVRILCHWEFSSNLVLFEDVLGRLPKVRRRTSKHLEWNRRDRRGRVLETKESHELGVVGTKTESRKCERRTKDVRKDAGSSTETVSERKSETSL